MNPKNKKSRKEVDRYKRYLHATENNTMDSYKNNKKRKRDVKHNKKAYNRFYKFDVLISTLKLFKIEYKFAVHSKYGSASLYILKDGCSIVRISDHDYNPNSKDNIKEYYHIDDISDIVAFASNYYMI